MRPKFQHPTATTTSTASGGLQRWSSPVPYLFGAIALTMGIIALALVILACSYRKSSSSSSESSNNKSSEETVHVLQPEMEPKIVVIMAGDTNPTYLAKPIASVHAE